MAEALPSIPGLRDLAGLFRYLDETEAALKKKWLTDAREVVKQNEAAVRLLGATDKIERDLKAAETAKAKAAQAIEHANAAARSIIAEAEEGLVSRETALADREETTTERLAADDADLKRRIDEHETASRNTDGVLAERAEKLARMSRDLTQREQTVTARERRVTTREEEAKAAKAEAEALTERMGAAMAKPAQPAA